MPHSIYLTHRTMEKEKKDVVWLVTTSGILLAPSLTNTGCFKDWQKNKQNFTIFFFHDKQKLLVFKQDLQTSPCTLIKVVPTQSYNTVNPIFLFYLFQKQKYFFIIFWFLYTILSEQKLFLILKHLHDHFLFFYRLLI